MVSNDKMYRTLSILLKCVHKDVILLITRYFHAVDKIGLILVICPKFQIKKKIKSNLFENAAFYGSLGMMKYMLSNNFPYNSWVFEYAAKNGKLENLKWLLDNNFPYNKHLMLSCVSDPVVKEWINTNL